MGGKLTCLLAACMFCICMLTVYLIVQCFVSLQIELSMNGETKTLTVEEGTSILEAAEIAFDDPPFSCRNGVCTTCK
jgi:2Fe-2S iron-sulfur cluster binding domain